MDYLVPSPTEVPSMVTDYTVTPSTSNPLGVKGAGEAGTISSAAAVMNAVVDALSPYGGAIRTCQPRHSECGERSTTRRTEAAIPAAFDHLVADSAESQSQHSPNTATRRNSSPEDTA